MNPARVDSKTRQDRQLRAALILNWITGVGTAAALIGLLFVWQTLLATKKAADAAADGAVTAQRSLQETVNTFRVDERAWLEIEPIKPTLLSPGSDQTPARFQCDLYLRNLGKTVASEISLKASNALSTDDFDKNREVLERSQDNVPAEATVSRAPRVLAPGAISAAPFRLTCSAPKIYAGGGESIDYLLGRIDYTDQFQVKHWLRFCYFVVNARAEVWNCREGNDEDRNPEVLPAESQKAQTKEGLMIAAWHLVANNFDRVLALLAIVIAVIAMLDVRRLFQELQHRDETTEQRVKGLILQELQTHATSFASFLRAAQFIEFDPTEVTKETALMMLMTFRLQQLSSPDMPAEEHGKLRKATRERMESTAREYAEMIIKSGLGKLKPGIELQKTSQ